jgi:hypothetical protein
MKAGAENRKKTITLGALAAVAVCGIVYNLFALFGGGPSTPPPAIAPVATGSTASRPSTAGNAAGSGTAGAGNRSSAGNGAIPGVPAQKLASSAGSLDPTLDQAAMLRTESLVYSGSGRNVFSATYVAVADIVPRNVPSPRPLPSRPAPPVYTGPPAPPPIPLKFFGTAQRTGAAKQAFLLNGDDVYLASPGDIVAKRFKVVAISPFSVTVTDLGSNNTQSLPLQQQ